MWRGEEEERKDDVGCGLRVARVRARVLELLAWGGLSGAGGHLPQSGRLLPPHTPVRSRTVHTVHIHTTAAGASIASLWSGEYYRHHDAMIRSLSFLTVDSGQGERDAED